MTTCAEYTARLAEADAAMHKLMLGGKVESIQDGEKRITYTKGDISKLQTYIGWLQNKVDACSGLRTPKRVIHFTPVDR